MGFLSKAWKGIKDTFKSIGKEIKRAAGKVGKFMDKIGVVGQIALMFVLPGIGGALAKGLGAGVGAMAGSSSAIVSGVGKILQTAGKFASTVGNAYKTVSNGISSFVSNVGKGVINQVASFAGKSTPLIANSPATVGEGFKAFMSGVADDVSNITSPFRQVANTVEVGVSKAYESSLGLDDPDTFEVAKPFQSAAEDFRFYEVPKENISTIVDSERKGFNKFLSDVGSYATTAVKQLPGKAIDTVAGRVTEGVGMRAAQKLGLASEPQYTVQNVSNVVPQFNSAPIQSRYEASGINYGATPNSRIEFFAANLPQYGDFGRTAFNNFASIRTV
jgi:hypothetical protein